MQIRELEPKNITTAITTAPKDIEIRNYNIRKGIDYN